MGIRGTTLRGNGSRTWWAFHRHCTDAKLTKPSNGGLDIGEIPRARANLLRTRSGPREPGVAAASTARRGRIERRRRALAPRLPRPPELRGACGRAACAAPRRSARRRLPSVTAEPRAPPRMRRCPSGRRPVERGGRDERLDGQRRVHGRKGRQRGGAHAADRPWRERQLARCGAPPHVPRVGARVLAASAAFAAALARDGAVSPELAVPRAAALAAPPPRRPAELGTRVLVAWRAPHPRVLAHAPRVLWHSMTPRVLHLPSTDTQL